MAVIRQQLQGLTNAEFGKAENHFRTASHLQVLVTLLAASSVFITNNTISLAAGISSLAFFAWWAFHDWSYRDIRNQAERGRRALWIADGLGDKISKAELRDVESDFHSSKEEGKAAENPDYFASKEAAGEGRLAALIEESGFYSCRLYRLSAKWAWKRFSIAVAIAIGMLLLSIVFVTPDHLVSVGRLVCTGLVFFLGSEVLGAARGYSRAHEGLSSLQARIRAARANNYPAGDLLLLFTDYNSAVEGAPLMAPGIYKRNSAALDELWRRHLEEA